MKTITRFRAILYTALFLAAAGPAFQPHPSSASLIGDSSALFVFGDSLSDTGNLFAASVGTVPPAATYRDGRFSNGPVWVDRLSAVSGLALTPTTQIFAPTADGINFAFGCATSGTANVFGGGLPGLTQQLGMFQGLLGGGLINPDADALYILWAGANDYLGGGIFDPTIPVGNLSAAIAELYGLRGRRFLVPNLPDLGATPLGAAVDPVGLTTLTDFHNTSLTLALGNLSATLSGIEIVALDVHQAFDDLLTDPAAFGLTNPFVPCLDATITGLPTGACPDVAGFDAGGAVFLGPAASHGEGAPRAGRVGHGPRAGGAQPVRFRSRRARFPKATVFLPAPLPGRLGEAAFGAGLRRRDRPRIADLPRPVFRGGRDGGAVERSRSSFGAKRVARCAGPQDRAVALPDDGTPPCAAKLPANHPARRTAATDRRAARRRPVADGGVN